VSNPDLEENYQHPEVKVHNTPLIHHE